MNGSLTTIRLNGALGKKFGRVHQFVVYSAAGAVKALSVMIPGFQQELINSQDKGVDYAVFVGKENIQQEKLHSLNNNKTIKIVPVIRGSKAAGVFQILAAVVLVVAAFVVGGPAFSGVAATALFSAGAAMALGGLISLLSPQQNISSKNNPNNGTSYNFDGPVNTTVQGNPVPLLYGKIMAGSAVISAGIYTQDKQ